MIIKFFKEQVKDRSFKYIFIIWFEEIAGTLLRYIPGIIGWLLRFFLFKLLFKRITGFCYIHTNVRFVHSYNIEFGKRIGVNCGCQFLGRGGIKVGNFCQFGPNVIITSYNHAFSDKKVPIDIQGYAYKPVIIEDNVWIGAGSIILPGVTLKKGTIIGAGSVVTKSTEADGIYVGNPAKLIKYRGENE